MTFKLKTVTQGMNSSNGSQESSTQIKASELQNNFFTITVKKTNYSGKPAIAVYIDNVTKKLNARVTQLKRLEEKQ